MIKLEKVENMHPSKKALVHNYIERLEENPKDALDFLETNIVEGMCKDTVGNLARLCSFVVEIGVAEDANGPDVPPNTASAQELVVYTLTLALLDLINPRMLIEAVTEAINDSSADFRAELIPLGDTDRKNVNH